MMTVRTATATNAVAWDAYVASQRFRPFLQSWTMGDVYARTNQAPLRFIAEEHGVVKGVCMALLIPARRGRHLTVPYGPIADDTATSLELLRALCDVARTERCGFVRISPFTPIANGGLWLEAISAGNLRPAQSPLHLLAEHVWYLPLMQTDPWSTTEGAARTEDDLLAGMRKTTRNLVRRAEKDGVTVRASTDPTKDVEAFIRLHDETRKRHKFTPYTNGFFRAQVECFAPRGECTVYLAEYQGQVIAASIHMHAFGETSYHHGASDSAHNKVPASYLLQWTAIRDALKRGDRVYNFWGIAPMHKNSDGDMTIAKKNHPFAGVTLFKTGFGGHLLDLQACTDLPLAGSYLFTRWFEILRKWKRGF